MANFKYKNLYVHLESEISKQGLGLRYRDYATIYGKCLASDKILCIDKKIRYTLLGCIILLHEYNHFLQYSDGRFLLFFKDKLKGNKKYTNKQKFEYVFAMENDCFQFAKSILREYGVFIPKSIKLVDPIWLRNNLLETWGKSYTAQS